MLKVQFTNDFICYVASIAYAVLTLFKNSGVGDLVFVGYLVLCKCSFTKQWPKKVNSK